LAYSLLCFIDQAPNSCLMQFWIFIHHAYFFVYQITITIQKKRIFVTQFQFFYVLVSIHESFFIALQGRNETISQPDANMHSNMYFSCRKCL